MGVADPARPFDPDWCPSIQIGESLSATIGDDGRRPDHSKKHLSRPGTGAFFLLFSVESAFLSRDCPVEIDNR